MSAEDLGPLFRKPQRTYRKTDPITSSEANAWAVSSGLAPNQRKRAYLFVRDNPGYTAAEIEREVGFKAHKVLPGLRDETGLVENGPIRKCDVSGLRAMTWYIKDTAPLFGAQHGESHGMDANLPL